MTQWWAPYIGRPFHPESFSCWGLVRAVYRAELGIELPAYGEVSARDLVRVVRAMRDFDGPQWGEAVGGCDYDVVLMRGTGGATRVIHCGLMAGGEVLHVEEASATVRVPVHHLSVAGRIMGYRRPL